jgi:hypothetical protein
MVPLLRFDSHGVPAKAGESTMNMAENAESDVKHGKVRMENLLVSLRGGERFA